MKLKFSSYVKQSFLQLHLARIPEVLKYLCTSWGLKISIHQYNNFEQMYNFAQ